MSDNSSKAVEYFDTHADYYERNQYRTARRTFVNGRHERLVAIIERLPAANGASVLDVGCGPGTLTFEFWKRGYRVFALDTSGRMLQIARSKIAPARSRGAHFQMGSIEALPFADDSFDIVCSAGVIEYLRKCDRAIGGLPRVLKPGGLLILPTTNMLAPAHWLRPLLVRLGRNPLVASRFGLQPGSYRQWFHFIPRFRGRLRSSGMALEQERYFYFTLPRPLDRLFPTFARKLETFFDRYMNTCLRHLAEGYIAIARKPKHRSVGIDCP